MPQHVYESESLADLDQVAEKLLTSCKDARIFAFFGKLGAGKTTLIQQMCKLLGVKEAVTSPTFNLVNEYSGTTETIYHFDFYRISSEQEAYDIGTDEYLDSGNFVFVEWPERIPTLLPEDAIHIKIAVDQNEKRNFTVTS
jgi:tRNA threonylcarbamoyladenosine biosynthesis protein TsaE